MTRIKLETQLEFKIAKEKNLNSISTLLNGATILNWTTNKVLSEHTYNLEAIFTTLGILYYHIEYFVTLLVDCVLALLCMGVCRVRGLEGRDRGIVFAACVKS